MGKRGKVGKTIFGVCGWPDTEISRVRCFTTYYSLDELQQVSRLDLRKTISKSCLT